MPRVRFEKIDEVFSSVSFYNEVLNPKDVLLLDLCLIHERLFSGEEKSMSSFVRSCISEQIKEDFMMDDFHREIDRISEEDIKNYAKYLICEFYVNDLLNNDQHNTIQLSDLALSFLKVENNEALLDFGSGYGAFLCRASECLNKTDTNSISLTGVETNSQSYAISKIAFEILDVNGDIHQGDYLEEDLPDFDKGFVFPTINARFTSGINSLCYPELFFQNNASSFGWVYVDKMLHNLKDNGRIVALLPIKSLFSSSDEEYRRKLINDGLIEGIVELPSFVISMSSVKMAFVVLSKGNSSTKIVDASNMVIGERMRRYNVEMDLERITKSYFSSDCFVVPKNDLLTRNNHTPSSILAKPGEIENGRLLGEIANVYSGSQYTINKFKEYISARATERRIISPSDIDNGMIEWDRLPYISGITKFDKYSIEKDDLIITSKSSKIKIAVVDIEPEETVIATGGMLVVRPFSELDPTFLKIFLESAEGQKAIKSIQKGNTITTINAKDLQTIVVPVPDLDYQKRIAKKYNNQLTTLRALREEANNIENRLKNFYESEVES